MNRRTITCSILCVLALLSSSWAQESPRTVSREAQRAATDGVPRLVKYSALLKDRLGKPLTDIVGVTFLIYKDAEGGVPLWMETQNVKPDSTGSYSVLLGAESGIGLPLDLFKSGEPRWLSMQVNLPGEEEQARVQLVSVPFALKAADAETLGGKPLSAFVLVDPRDAGREQGTNPSIPEGSLPGTKSPALTAPTAAISGTGTTNKVSKWTDGPNGVLGDSAIIDSSGKIGIGTTSTGPALHVVAPGNWGSEPIRAQTSASTGGTFFSAADYQGNQRFAINNDTGPTLNFYGYDTNWFPFMSVKESGSKFVGMGTTSPSSYQHQGTNRLLEVSNPGTSSNSQAHLILSSGTNNQAGSSIGSLSWAQPNASSSNKGVAYIAAFAQSTNPGAPAASMHFNTRSTSDTDWVERMRIDTAGKVGIGTTAPDRKLEVAGPTGSAVHSRLINLGNAGTDSAIQEVLVNGTSAGDPITTYTVVGATAWAIGIDNSDSDKFKIAAEGALGNLDRVTITTSGSVGIGTASPTSVLHVEQNNATLNLIAPQGSPVLRIADSPNASTRKEFYILNDTSANVVSMQAIQQGVAARNIAINADGGNVGIGTPSPQQKLHVSNGNLKISGTPGTHGIIFPDSTIQTTACGSLAFSAPGQLSTSGVHAVSDAAPVQVSDIHVEQQRRIEQLEAEVANLKAKLEGLLRDARR